MSNVHPRLGALKDPIDIRDFELRKIIRPMKLPAIVDYEKQMGTVKDQGNRGACVSFATAAVKEYQERKQRKGKVTYDFSEEFIYRQIMVAGGGAYPRDAFKCLANSGIPRDRYMPYVPEASDDEKLPFEPTKAAIRNGLHYKAGGYARLTSLEEMKQSLAINGPFLIGVDWLDGWFNPNGEIHDGYPILQPGEGSDVGGHAVAVVGYDDVRQVMKFKNSWGPDWGKGGYAYFHYNTIRENLWDAWATLDMESKNVKVNEVTKMKEQVDG